MLSAKVWERMEKTRHFIICQSGTLEILCKSLGTSHSCCISPMHPFCIRDKDWRREIMVSVVNETMWSVRWTPIVLLSCSYSLVKPRVSTVKTTLLSRAGGKAKGEPACTQSSVVSHIGVHQQKYLNEWSHSYYSTCKFKHLACTAVEIVLGMEAFYISIAIDQVLNSLVAIL